MGENILKEKWFTLQIKYVEGLTPTELLTEVDGYFDSEYLYEFYTEEGKVKQGSDINELKQKYLNDLYDIWSEDYTDIQFKERITNLQNLLNKKPMLAKPKGKKGWKSESVRHSLARKGIKTGRKKR